MSADLSLSFDQQNWKKLDLVKSWVHDDSITNVEVKPWGSGGGLNGEVFIVHVTKHDSTSAKYFVKMTKESGLGISQAVGLAREGTFYNWGPTIPAIAPVLPKVFFSYADFAAGRKVTALELIDGDQAGYFFGSNSCHNWERNLAELTAPYPGITERWVASQCFKAAASIQAPYWGKVDELVTDPKFATLRYRDWVRGEGKEGWLGVASWAVNGWANAKPKLAAKGVVMPANLSAIMDASLSKSTFEAYLEFVKSHPQTLVHGDFHPSNFVVRKPNQNGQCGIVLVDWEVVGIGSGPQDLGQFMISHSFPEQRRSMERELVQEYVDELRAKGIEITFEYAWQEYCEGGLGRFIWLLGIMIGGTMSAELDQYFINQVAAFADDHGFNAENAPLMRV